MPRGGGGVGGGGGGEGELRSTEKNLKSLSSSFGLEPTPLGNRRDDKPQKWDSWGKRKVIKLSPFMNSG